MALTKATSTLLVDPGRPGVPAVPAKSFSLIAAPPPKGWQYNTPLPKNMSEFRAWKQLVQAPAPTSRPEYIFRVANVRTYSDFKGSYVLVDDAKYYLFEALVKTGTNYLASAPIYGQVVIDGFGNRVPPPGYEFVICGRKEDAAQQASYSYAPSGMTYVQMHAPTLPNGYPADGRYDDAIRTWDLVGEFYVAGKRYEWPFVRLNNQGHLGFANNLYVPDATCWLGVLALDARPEVPAIPAIPATYAKNYNEGWNAGANSAAHLDGDVQVTFSVDIKTLGAVGFARPGTVPAGQYTKLDHAIYFSGSQFGTLVFQAMERGKLVGQKLDTYDGVDPANFSFRIKRVAGEVSFLASDNGGPYVEFYRSMAPSSGELMVSAALYRGEDKVI